MEVVYLLVALAAVLAGVVLWAFFWSVRTGQFDDLEGPAHRILMERDERDRPEPASPPGDPRSQKHAPGRGSARRPARPGRRCIDAR